MCQHVVPSFSKAAVATGNRWGAGKGRSKQAEGGAAVAEYKRTIHTVKIVYVLSRDVPCIARVDVYDRTAKKSKYSIGAVETSLATAIVVFIKALWHINKLQTHKTRRRIARS